MNKKPSQDEVDKAYRVIADDLKRKGWKQLIMTIQVNGDEDFYLHFLQDPKK